MKNRFDASTCDLCGSRSSVVLVKLATGRAMRSDRAVVDRDLFKVQCSDCGLVRCGDQLTSSAIAELYAESYGVGAAPDYAFYTEAGPVSRSAVLCDWISTAIGDRALARIGTAIEVGAAAGYLLEAFSRRHPTIRFVGIEPNRAGASSARARGLRVIEGGIDDFDAGTFDMAFSVAVIEHVPSPSEFLTGIRDRIREGGTLVLVQPTQDVPSYDVFFVDHLHHFGTAHVERLARKAGFREVSRSIGHPLMPNFSLHVFEAGAADAGADRGAFQATTCEQTVREIVARMELLDQTLARFASEGRRVAVFGLNEVFWLARAYSALGTFPVICGFDDSPDKLEYAHLGFPVVRPDDGRSLAIDTVIVAMNTIYYPIALPRLEHLGYDVHTVLA